MGKNISNTSLYDRFCWDDIKDDIKEVIENFMLYLTGNRLSQEDAVPIHSLLYEDALLMGNTDPYS